MAASRKQCSGQCDADLAAQMLGTSPQLKTAYSLGTCRRYLMVADRFNKDFGMFMDRWDMNSGRACLLDQLHTMRSAVTAARTQPEMFILVKTLFWEQKCKLRTTRGAAGQDFRG